MIRGVAALSIGQILNQLVTLVGYIYLARIYEIEDFGELAFVLAVGSLVGGVSTFQYELTVLIPKYERMARLGGAVTATTTLLVHFFYIFVLAILCLISVFSVFTALSIFFVSLATATVSLASSILNRAEKYVFLASINVARTLLALVLGVSFAVFEHSNGLVVAHGLASFFLSIFLIFMCVRMSDIVFLLRNPRRYYSWLKRHRDFAFFTTPAAFFSYLASSMPVFLLKIFFGEREVGLYSMLQRILMGPIGIVSGAVNRVFHRELTRRIYSGETVKGFYDLLGARLSLLGFAGVGVLCLASYFNVMSFVFGAKWVELNSLLMLFSPAAFGAFIAVSLSGFSVIGFNKVGMQFQLFNLIVGSCSIAICYSVFGEFEMVMLGYAAGLALSYILHWLVMSFVITQKESAF